MGDLLQRLRAIRGKLKSGEYDGADLMEAWCAAQDGADMIERLQAALAETEQKLDAWYRTEAQLHAAIHRHGGGDAVRAAIAELAISPIEHNPRLVVETAGGT